MTTRYDSNFYEQILSNFDEFCSDFEDAAAKRFSGLDDDSRIPVTNEQVQRATPAVVREIEQDGGEDLIIRTTPIDVQTPPLPELYEAE